MRHQLCRGKGRVHDARYPWPFEAAADSLLARPDGENRLVVFEHAVADEEAEEIALGVIARDFALVSPRRRKAVIVEQYLIARLER